MNIVPETKACESCAKSKRKCGKERPRCHRCSSRDQPCEYPPARPSSFVLLADESETPQSCATSVETKSAAGAWSPSMLFDPLTDFDVPLPSGEIDLQLSRPLFITPAKHLTCDWFMSPSTWKCPEVLSQRQEPGRPPQPMPPYGNRVLKRYLKDMERQLGGWVSTGGTTFIHKQLYTLRRPRCILDAQTALALYLSRTDENEEMVFRALDDRAEQLLLEEEKHRTSSSHNTFDHLARVQSLLTYQVMGLLDGDIHQRATAEERMKTLMDWVNQMVESVRVASTFVPASHDGDHSVVAKGLGLNIKGIIPDQQALLNSVTQEEVIWHIWICTESLRRTWIAVQGLNATYHALKKGWALCPGSMKLTAGKGVWDASSSFTWAQVIRATNVWFMECVDTEILFTHATPDQVDDFTKSCMEISFGMERMERWGFGAAYGHTGMFQ